MRSATSMQRPSLRRTGIAKSKRSACLTLALSSTLVLAGPPAPKAAGIESKDYQWAKMEGELKEALAKKGDVKRGKDTYEICGACHLPSGAGRPDGTFGPTAPVTRDAMAAFLYRYWKMQGPFALEDVEFDYPDPGFSDVPANHPFHDEIAWMAALLIAGEDAVMVENHPPHSLLVLWKPPKPNEPFLRRFPWMVSISARDGDGAVAGEDAGRWIHHLDQQRAGVLVPVGFAEVKRGAKRLAGQDRAPAIVDGGGEREVAAEFAGSADVPVRRV